MPTPTDVDNPFAEEAPEPEDIVSATGTVRYIDLEGGFFGIVARDGTKYLPRNLEDALREDGQEVRFRAKRLRDVVTMQQWGQPIEILKIEPITVLDDE